MAEFKVWAELTPAGQVHIVVTASSLVGGDQPGRFVLVVDEGTFRSLAAHDVVQGREYLTAAFRMDAGGRCRWGPHLVPREQLAERFEAVRLAEAGPTEDGLTRGIDRGREGFLGEIEVVRRLAEALNLFRPFPDLEIVEVLARHIASRRFFGLQVKAVGWDKAHLENRVYVRRSSFQPSPSTFVCVLGWNRDSSRFEDDCLLIPSEDVAGITRVDGEWMVLELEPGGVRHRRLDRYRESLLSLGLTVESMLA